MIIEGSGVMDESALDGIEMVDFHTLTPRAYQHTCITIGNFDGVHLGHQAIIKKMVQAASQDGQAVVVVTFYPNPTDYFQPDDSPFYLSTPAEKTKRLKSLGARAVITFRFDRDFADLSAEEFLSGLHAKLGLSTLVVGPDFALGKNRKGTIPVIRAIGERLGFSLKALSPIEAEEGEISSTRIRSLLDAGDVRGASRLLGRPYQIAGSVTHGSDRGARIGLPTANLSYWLRKKRPAVGVYATHALVGGTIHQGLTNVGVRPTFEKQALPNIETHLLNFDGNIYGQPMALDFIDRIRDEQKFSGVDALLAQIERDKITAQRIFSHAEKQADLPA